MINNIYHIADLHIRADRRNEYLPVFNRLIEYIKNDVTTESLVVICGDIFHYMTRYQGPDDITDFCQLVGGLSNICPVIIIPGNHDTNMNNRNNRDLITPIYDMLRQYKSNICYYSKTDVYKYDNIYFAPLSVIDNESPQTLAAKVMALNPASNEYKIALVHEDINGATFGDFIIKNARVDKDFIACFDYVLAGHIHDMQVIEADNTKVAYCGALFQQDIGESLSKGLIKWNLAAKTHEFIRIPNDYGAIKLTIDNNQLYDIPADLYPKCIKDVMIEHKNTNPDYIKTVVEEFSARYNFLIKRIVDKTPKSDKPKVQSAYNSNILETSLAQEDIISKFLQDKNINKETIEDIVDIHKSYNKSTPPSINNNNKRWRIVSMEWSNLFCYGENNYIDFTAIPAGGLLGIIANNRAGKSSIIDILLYGLFNKLRRGDVKHVTRLGAKYYYLRLVIEVDGRNLVIIRQSNGTSGANATTYFSINNENKTRESVTLTYQDISLYIGTYDDFIKTNIMCQDNADDFVKMSSVNRRKFLIKFFQLDTWIDIESQVRKDILEITKDINNSIIPNHTIESLESNYIPGLKGELTTVVQDINAITAAQTKHQTAISKLQTDKDELLKMYDSGGVNITSANYDSARTTRDTLIKRKPVQTLDELNELLHKKMAEYRKVGDVDKDINIDNIKAEYETILADMKQYDGIRGDISEVSSALKELSAERLSLQYKIKGLSVEANPLQRALLSLKTIYETHIHFADHVKYTDSCTSCATNKPLIDSLMAEIRLQESKTNKLAANITNIKDNEIEIAELQKRLTVVIEEEHEVGELLDNLIKKQKIRERYIKVRDIITNYDDIAHNAQITTHIEYIKKVIKQVELYNQVEKTIASYEHNLDINGKLRTINITMVDHNSQLLQLQADMVKISKRYGELETKLTNTEDLLARLKSKSAHRDCLRLYLTCLDSKTGIPFKILSNTLAALESKVNSLLGRITDFSLSFINDDDGKKESELRVSIVSTADNKKATLPVELGSGFQQFIISIILRISLAQMFPAHLSDFFIIDEGFSCMDAANINNAQQFLLYIKQYFRFILIISHLDVLQNMIEYPISIDTSNGISNIKNIDVIVKHELLKTEKQSKLVRRDALAQTVDLYAAKAQTVDLYAARAQTVDLHAARAQTVERPQLVVDIETQSIVQTITQSIAQNAEQTTIRDSEVTVFSIPISPSSMSGNDDDKKKDSTICQYCKIDVAKSYYARHVKTKKHIQAVKDAGN